VLQDEGDMNEESGAPYVVGAWANGQRTCGPPLWKPDKLIRMNSCWNAAPKVATNTWRDAGRPMRVKADLPSGEGIGKSGLNVKG